MAIAQPVDVVYLIDQNATDSLWDTPPQDGTVAIDVENKAIWTRCRGAWFSVAVA